ncbi:MAG: hypothetical protein C0507_03845 [Cyanobacteria bacterium PR.3.49]|nr:hypothetical protein [Cyanobacteria bacterium PR.3.49]
MKIKNSQTKLTAAEIEQLESHTCISLPADYKAFLLEHNGGEPDPSDFVTRDGKVESFVSCFLPISNLVEDNLLEEIEGISQAGQIPSNLIPIAIAAPDNRIVIAFKGKERGKVYYWAWDEEDENHIASYKYIRLIADSFDDFIRLLH